MAPRPVDRGDLRPAATRATISLRKPGAPSVGSAAGGDRTKTWSWASRAAVTLIAWANPGKGRKGRRQPATPARAPHTPRRLRAMAKTGRGLGQPHWMLDSKTAQVSPIWSEMGTGAEATADSLILAPQLAERSPGGCHPTGRGSETYPARISGRVLQAARSAS